MKKRTVKTLEIDVTQAQNRREARVMFGIQNLVIVSKPRKSKNTK